MDDSKKDRKDDSKTNSRQPDSASEPVELKAIVPDQASTKPEGAFDDIDAYQRKMDEDWESAKNTYQQKIQQIVDDFTKTNLFVENPEEQPPEPPAPKARPANDENSFKKLMARVEKVLREDEAKPYRATSFDFGPSVISIPFRQSIYMRFKKIMKVVLIVLAVGGAAIGTHVFRSVAPMTPLPYLHTAGVIVTKNRVYITDWFRKALYVHARTRGLPILSVENLPNGFATGFAFAGKRLWTVDGFNHELVEHALEEDHHVLSRIQTPGKKPVGLIWDGTDFWSADKDTNALYRLRGNEVTDVIDQYSLPALTLTDFTLVNNKVWILDGRSREISVYRLQEPLRELARFDLDPFLKGAVPTGLDVEDDTLWLTTETPPQLLQIPRSKLEKSTPDRF